MAHPGGRPEKFTPEELAEIVQDFSDYVKRTADPTIVGFTAYYDKYDVRKTFINDRPEFSGLVKRAIEKQEAYLQDGAVKNRLNATFTIFRLKQPQHGWTDKVEQDVKLEQVQPIVGGLAKSDVHTNDDDQEASETA